MKEKLRDTRYTLRSSRIYHEGVQRGMVWEAIFEKLMTENFYLLKENMSPSETAFELPSKRKVRIIQKYIMAHCADILEFKDKKKLLTTIWGKKEITYKAIRVREIMKSEDDNFLSYKENNYEFRMLYYIKLSP